MVFPEDYNLAYIVGKNITRMRKKVGMNQDKLAEALRISSPALSRIERGLSAPRFGRIQEVANLLQCEVIDLFRNDDQPLALELDRIKDMLRGLPVSTQEELIGLFENMISIIKKTKGLEDNSNNMTDT